MPYLNQSRVAELITEEIKTFVRTSSANRLRPNTAEPAFATSLIGFARGEDPLFQHFKKHVGDFHWTPVEAFSLAFPEEEVQA